MRPFETGVLAFNREAKLDHFADHRGFFFRQADSRNTASRTCGITMDLKRISTHPMDASIATCFADLKSTVTDPPRAGERASAIQKRRRKRKKTRIPSLGTQR